MASTERPSPSSAPGGRVLVVDDDRENEGDLIMAAEQADTDSVAFFLEHTSGFLCVAIDQRGAEAHRLGPPSSSCGRPPRGRILDELGIGRVRLATDNPEKIGAREQHGIDVVQRIAHESSATLHDVEYLTAERDRMAISSSGCADHPHPRRQRGNA
ncbi:hypothetical protein GCM10023215_31720 [Pseudonocardia yuanmonensis]|uniref:3,4-dihydroxy-2-butanone-4-phosphate synthase n=1 Tax=Pseudonocardia yuanmonensis TaxID=1095914 RepID=A0ABP8WPW5_9PSEU